MGKYISRRIPIRLLLTENFQIYIQPQVDLSTGKLVGGEALVRWIRSDGEMISPGRFVPILEKKV